MDNQSNFGALVDCLSSDFCRNAAVWALWKKTAIGHTCILPVLNHVILFFFAIVEFNSCVKIKSISLDNFLKIAKMLQASIYFIYCPGNCVAFHS